jgi:site-specific recombinase XerD
VKNTPEPTPPAGGLPSEQAFHVWATVQKALGELSDASIGKYKPLWMAWLSWGLQRGIAWNAIQSEDIQTFLQGSAPGQGVSRRRAINPDRMSSYTRQRYYRLLKGVYTTANKLTLIDHNPALDIDEKDRPAISENDRMSQVLEPFLFRELVKPERIKEIFPEKTKANWWHARDRAIIAVLVETGITVTELIALRGMDLVEAAQGRGVATPNVQKSMFATPNAELLLDVMDTSSKVGRTLSIGPQLAPLVRAWLAWRHRLLVERSAVTEPLNRRDQFMATHGLNGPLFVALRTRSGTEMFPLMDPTSVYHTVSQALKRLRQMQQLESLAYVAKGPAVVRNSVIRRWIDEYGPEEAAAMAGLKNTLSLRLKAT